MLTGITSISTDEGWLYLAGQEHFYTEAIVGYAMSSRITRNWVSQSPLQAVATKSPAVCLIHHSYRGSQYCSGEYRKFLRQFNMKISMIRKGNCSHNAPIESFLGTLKSERIYHRRYRSRQEAVNDIRTYVEVFNNRQRKQKRLGYLSPQLMNKSITNFKKRRHVLVPTLAKRPQGILCMKIEHATRIS